MESTDSEDEMLFNFNFARSKNTPTLPSVQKRLILKKRPPVQRPRATRLSLKKLNREESQRSNGSGTPLGDGWLTARKTPTKSPVVQTLARNKPETILLDDSDESTDLDVPVTNLLTDKLVTPDKNRTQTSCSSQNSDRSRKSVDENHSRVPEAIESSNEPIYGCSWLGPSKFKLVRQKPSQVNRNQHEPDEVQRKSYQQEQTSSDDKSGLQNFELLRPSSPVFDTSPFQSKFRDSSTPKKHKSTVTTGVKSSPSDFLTSPLCFANTENKETRTKESSYEGTVLASVKHSSVTGATSNSQVKLTGNKSSLKESHQKRGTHKFLFKRNNSPIRVEPILSSAMFETNYNKTAATPAPRKGTPEKQNMPYTLKLPDGEWFSSRLQNFGRKLAQSSPGRSNCSLVHSTSDDKLSTRAENVDESSHMKTKNAIHDVSDEVLLVDDSDTEIEEDPLGSMQLTQSDPRDGQVVKEHSTNQSTNQKPFTANLPLVNDNDKWLSNSSDEEMSESVLGTPVLTSPKEQKTTPCSVVLENLFWSKLAIRDPKAAYYLRDAILHEDLDLREFVSEKILNDLGLSKHGFCDQLTFHWRAKFRKPTLCHDKSSKFDLSTSNTVINISSDNEQTLPPFCNGNVDSNNHVEDQKSVSPVHNFTSPPESPDPLSQYEFEEQDNISTDGASDEEETENCENINIQDNDKKNEQVKSGSTSPEIPDDLEPDKSDGDPDYEDLLETTLMDDNERDVTNPFSDEEDAWLASQEFGQVVDDDLIFIDEPEDNILADDNKNKCESSHNSGNSSPAVNIQVEQTETDHKSGNSSPAVKSKVEPIEPDHKSGNSRLTVNNEVEPIESGHESGNSSPAVNMEVGPIAPGYKSGKNSPAVNMQVELTAPGSESGNNSPAVNMQVEQIASDFKSGNSSPAMNIKEEQIAPDSKNGYSRPSVNIKVEKFEPDFQEQPICFSQERLNSSFHAFGNTQGFSVEDEAIMISDDDDDDLFANLSQCVHIKEEPEDEEPEKEEDGVTKVTDEDEHPKSAAEAGKSELDDDDDELYSMLVWGEDDEFFTEEEAVSEKDAADAATESDEEILSAAEMLPDIDFPMLEPVLIKEPSVESPINSRGASPEIPTLELEEDTQDGKKDESVSRDVAQDQNVQQKTWKNKLDEGSRKDIHENIFKIPRTEAFDEDRVQSAAENLEFPSLSRPMINREEPKPSTSKEDLDTVFPRASNGVFIGVAKPGCDVDDDDDEVDLFSDSDDDVPVNRLSAYLQERFGGSDSNTESPDVEIEKSSMKPVKEVSKVQPSEVRKDEFPKGKGSLSLFKRPQPAEKFSLFPRKNLKIKQIPKQNSVVSASSHLDGTKNPAQPPVTIGTGSGTSSGSRVEPSLNRANKDSRNKVPIIPARAPTKKRFLEDLHEKRGYKKRRRIRSEPKTPIQLSQQISSAKQQLKDRAKVVVRAKGVSTKQRFRSRTDSLLKDLTTEPLPPKKSKSAQTRPKQSAETKTKRPDKKKPPDPREEKSSMDKNTDKSVVQVSGPTATVSGSKSVNPENTACTVDNIPSLPVIERTGTSKDKEVTESKITKPPGEEKRKPGKESHSSRTDSDKSRRTNSDRDRVKVKSSDRQKGDRSGDRSEKHSKHKSKRETRDNDDKRSKERQRHSTSKVKLGDKKTVSTEPVEKENMGKFAFGDILDNMFDPNAEITNSQTVHVAKTKRTSLVDSKPKTSVLDNKAATTVNSGVTNKDNYPKTQNVPVEHKNKSEAPRTCVVNTSTVAMTTRTASPVTVTNCASSNNRGNSSSRLAVVGTSVHGVPSGGQKTSSVSEDIRNRNWNTLLRDLLSWNAKWLSEVGECGGLPPAIEDLETYPLLFSYETYTHYFNIMKPLLLLEIWESLVKQWSDGGKNKLSTLQCAVHRPNMIGNNLMVLPLQAIQGKSDNSNSRSIREADLVILKMVINDPSQEDVYYPVFGYVDSVKRSQRQRYGAELHPELAKKAAARELGSQVLDILVKVKFRKLPLKDVLIDVQNVTSMTSVQRQFMALLLLPNSRLARDIYRPTSDQVFYHNPPSRPRLPQDCNYNPSQRDAIERITNAMLQPYILPKICLLQGPPGTGKSKTIVGIILTTVQNRTADGMTPRILLCAPSNGAVDEILCRLAGRKVSTPKGKRTLRCVRLGALESVRPDVQRHTLDQLAEYNIQKEIQDKLDKKMSSLTTQYNTLENMLHGVMDQIGRYEKEGNIPMIRKKQEEYKRLKQRMSVLQKCTKNNQTRNHADLDAVKKGIMHNADVICCTLNGSGSFTIMRHLSNTGPITCCIIDEACQSIELDCLIPLQHKLTKLTLVGDPEQLPATVISKKATELSFGQSLFERLSVEFRNHANSPVMMLTTQYRMHPEICSFPNQHVYLGKLETHPDTVRGRQSSTIRPYAVFNLHFSQEQQDKCVKHTWSVYNKYECNFIAQLLTEIERELKGRAVGVITPYRSQVTQLQKTLQPRHGDVEVKTLDAFQGREKDIIIISCVRARSATGGIGFLSDKRRMNVALTRAKYALYIVGHVDTLKGNYDWGSLINNARERQLIYDVPKEEPSLICHMIRKGCLQNRS